MEDMNVFETLYARNLFQVIRRLVLTSSDHPNDNIENPHRSNPSASPSGSSDDLSIELNPLEFLQADGLDGVAGTSPPATEVDVELGEGGIRSPQVAPSTSATRSDVEVEQEGGVMISRRRMAMLNVVIGLGLLNTSFFSAHSLAHSFYMMLSAVGVAFSLFRLYAGNRMPTKVQRALLLLSALAVLGPLLMVVIGASLHMASSFNHQR